MILSASGYLIDTNIWVALAFPDHPNRHAAQQAFARCSPQSPAVFCRSTQLSFLRLATTPAVFTAGGSQSITNRDAWIFLSTFLSQPNVVYADEPHGVWPIWNSLAVQERVSPKLWMDAYLAAFAMSGEYQLMTFDKGFAQFKGLDLHLISSS